MVALDDMNCRVHCAEQRPMSPHALAAIDRNVVDPHDMPCWHHLPDQSSSTSRFTAGASRARSGSGVRTETVKPLC
jgi:hypothetical protein